MKIKLFGSISDIKEIDVKIDNTKDLITVLKENRFLGKYILNNGRIRSDILLLINGVDYRLLGGVKAKLNDTDELIVIPINHGG